eukprot:CAMPEP_0197278310 /NCGR_PEP_ID=MMETSP1432-20130617/18458_1 /TAXON_ID=44447 /ORGANISM="Pseudo-nitzschia delicatissima, Strain UNC1205" /LENGTH=478 /DNA_ID=CAMNT_0042744663 /DNA_START=79 /DNA_END=1515 /DNA_ORIENTATION=-
MTESVPAIYKDNDKAIEQDLEKDFAKLSIDHRSQIAQEIDGTHCMAIEETPVLLESSLANLAVELKSISYKKKVGYNKSQKLPKTYINDPNFRLRFLRSQLFDVREAATRLVRYCDFVLDLFGTFALERQIERNDFSKKEMKWMLKGYIQLMPFRDQSGRRVIMQIMDSNIIAEQITRLKIYTYMAMMATADVETQRKGLILVVWPGGPGKDWKIRRQQESRAPHLLSQRHEVLPIRIAGYHYYMPDDPIFRLIRSFVVLYGGIGGMKSRMRFHIGRDTELRYILQGYGIPVEFIPVTGSGNIKLNLLKQWIRIRATLEAESRVYGSGVPFSGAIVECPGSTDVIFKPGKRLDYHPGNSLFQKLIRSRANEYSSTPSKRGLYRWLAMEIKERKGRFLKWSDNGYWTEIQDDAQITIKISTCCKAVLSKHKAANMKTSLVKSSTTAFVNNVNEQTLCTSNKRKRYEGNLCCDSSSDTDI